MPAPRKSTGTPAKVGVFARLKAEAERTQPAPDPYVIDDVEPPIVIEAPTDTEVQIGLADLMGSDGGFEVRNARRILELICGDSFDQVWELFRKEHISLLVRLIVDMADHFGPALNGDAGDLPGGSPASST